MPKFTVITATWNRSHHIIPTIQSVLAQSFTDFEYLIVGDCCTDDTEEVVRPFLSDRVRWLSTSERWRSQSGPNNVGIAAAKGDYVAYLGHDDIWSPDHLARHFDTFSQNPAADFSVAASMNYGSLGAGMDFVTALDVNAPLPQEYFFVPSVIAHRREVTERIGLWQHPDQINRLVDVDFQKRALEAGMVFVRNGALSVFKFTAGSRYLAYLEQDSLEQQQLLDRMNTSDFQQELAQDIAACVQSGRSFASQRIYGEGLATGEAALRSRAMKGLLESDYPVLSGKAKLPHHNGLRAQDWHGSQPDKAGRMWSGPNPAPRLLIPFRGKGKVTIAFNLFHPDPNVFSTLTFSLNGEPSRATIEPRSAAPRFAVAHVRMHAELRAHGPSVLRIFQPASAMSGVTIEQKRGVGIGPLTLQRNPTNVAARAFFAIGEFVTKQRRAVAARRNND